MDGKIIGELARRRGALAFLYAPEGLSAGLGRPLLSVAMPTRSRAFLGSIPHAFFNGLLPEGDARRMIAYDAKVDASDAFALLAAIGRDCAGALVIAPSGEDRSIAGVPVAIDERAIAERLRRLRIEPLGIDDRVRASLAGVQEKLLLAWTDQGWALPVDGAPSTHILKPRHPLFDHSIVNEAFCMRVAHHLGVSVAAVESRSFDGFLALVVERYDRTQTDAGTIRVHQEDFCQATSTDVERKYEEYGGPSLTNCAEILRKWSRADLQLEKLLDFVTLNVLLGNADAHGKNLALLHDASGGVDLAPFYDLTCTTWYPKLSTIAGMFVNGVRDITAIRSSDIVREAVRWGLRHDAASAQISALLGDAEQAIVTASAEIDPPDDLVALVRARATSLLTDSHSV